jgi:acetyl-CoA C-acetyltransferase
MDQIAIVGVGQTKHEKRKIGQTFETMVFEATAKALKDAGMTIQDIDNVVTVSNDFWDGRTISSMAIQDACGSYNKNISTVEGDGTFGILYGLLRILSGSFGTTLVVSHVKCSESPMNQITNAMFDPIYERQLGLDAISSSALQARAYMDKYGISEAQCAKISVKNHRNAKNNPYAQLPLDLTVEAVLKSKVLAEPIKLYDCSPITDGAAAVILANRRRAESITTKPVWIKGIGHCADAYHLGDRDLSECRALSQAAKRAYQMATIKNPSKEIDVAEVYDSFSYQELMWYELLGFCDRGEGGRLIDEGVTEITGAIPVNPSGGCLSAHPVIVAGMVRAIEATLQVRGEAGARQIAGVKTALAHGMNGPCGQSHCVIILGQE